MENISITSPTKSFLFVPSNSFIRVSRISILDLFAIRSRHFSSAPAVPPSTNALHRSQSGLKYRLHSLTILNIFTSIEVRFCLPWCVILTGHFQLFLHLLRLAFQILCILFKRPICTLRFYMKFIWL